MVGKTVTWVTVYNKVLFVKIINASTNINNEKYIFTAFIINLCLLVNKYVHDSSQCINKYSVWS